MSRCTRVKIGLFMTVSFLGWFTGMHYLYNFNVLQAGNGVGNEFLYIIAAVVGGTLMTGGYGNTIGVAIGSFIFGMTSLGIVYAGWDPNWFRAFLGVMLLLAVHGQPVRQEALDHPEGGLAMTDTLQEHADPTLSKGETLVQMIDVGKTYGAIRALKGINLTVNAGEVDLRPRRQRRRQVDPDQDHGRPAPAQRGRAARRRQAGHLRLPARGAVATASPPSTRTSRSSG